MKLTKMKTMKIKMKSNGHFDFFFSQYRDLDDLDDEDMEGLDTEGKYPMGVTCY